jgi:hypothetical protein
MSLRQFVVYLMSVSLQWEAGLFDPAVKRQEREADRSPPSSADVKMVKLYLHFPLRLHGVVLN